MTTTARASIAECLKYSEDGPSRIMLFPRPGRPDAGTRSASAPLAPLTFETIPFFAFHDANAYETSDGRVVVDTVAW